MKRVIFIFLLFLLIPLYFICSSPSEHSMLNKDLNSKSNAASTFYHVFNYAGEVENEDLLHYFKTDANVYFLTHLYLETMMVHGYPTVGGTWDLGVGVDTISIAFYMRYHHFFRPLGSDTGRLAAGEELGEIGLSFKVQIYTLGRFNVNLGVNTGWYQQWLMYSFNRGTYNLVNNGLMIRPEASIGFRFIKNWTMNLGFFYQTPLYPVYNDYEAWGWYLKIF